MSIQINQSKNSSTFYSKSNIKSSSADINNSKEKSNNSVINKIKENKKQKDDDPKTLVQSLMEVKEEIMKRRDEQIKIAKENNASQDTINNIYKLYKEKLADISSQIEEAKALEKAQDERIMKNKEEKEDAAKKSNLKSDKNNTIDSTKNKSIGIKKADSKNELPSTVNSNKNDYSFDKIHHQDQAVNMMNNLISHAQFSSNLNIVNSVQKKAENQKNILETQSKLDLFREKLSEKPEVNISENMKKDIEEASNCDKLFINSSKIFTNINGYDTDNESNQNKFEFYYSKNTADITNSDDTTSDKEESCLLPKYVLEQRRNDRIMNNISKTGNAEFKRKFSEFIKNGSYEEEISKIFEISV